MSDERIKTAARADLLLLTADMLRPPRADGILPEWVALSESDRRGVLDAAGLPGSTSSQGMTLATALQEVFDQARATSPGDWSDEYWRLFDSAIACPINQASYIRRDKGTILGDLAGFYRAFGWQQNVASGERPDHLLCQLEFVSVLMAMSANARTPEEQRIVNDAMASFARSHMHDWLPSFCWQLCESSRLPVFGAIAAWLVALWDGLTAACSWPVDETPAERRIPGEDVENPYECAAGGLVQLGDH
jgi:putative dimethyl sulfoxide reductase chaperone